MFSVAGAGDSWGVDWIGKENGPEERGSTSSAVFSNKTDTAQEPSRGVTEFGSLAKTTSAVSNDSITQTFEESKTTENNNPDAVDWEGNRETLPENKESDSRFSATDEGDSWGEDWIGKETGETDSSPAAQKDRTEATSSASRSEAHSPQGEGLEAGEADSSTSLRSAQNDNEGNGGRSMSAPTALSCCSTNPAPQPRQ